MVISEKWLDFFFLNSSKLTFVTEFVTLGKNRHFFDVSQRIGIWFFAFFRPLFSIKKSHFNYIYIFQELQLVEVLKLEMKLVFVIEGARKFKFYDLYGNLVSRKCPFSSNTIGITAVQSKLFLQSLNFLNLKLQFNFIDTKGRNSFSFNQSGIIIFQKSSQENVKIVG